MTKEQIDARFYAAQQLINWLVDGWDTNGVLKTLGASSSITPEWVVENYNVDPSFFKRK
jgi:hypothetical protein